jgi:hypothetical protein
MKTPIDAQSWKDDLRTSFDDLRVIEKCRAEAKDQFDQFCDFLVKPAFRALDEEFRRFRVKTKSWMRPGASIHLEIRFPQSRVDRFHYILWIPRHAVEFKLRLTTRGRKTPDGSLTEKTVPFIENVSPKEILGLDKDSLAQDIIARYRTFLYESASAPD